ncbi:MAG: UDP-4-amino-4,6-dideoxy-N-acetyl-beta-L-altrosamine N-acetyltransferase [Bacteroidota bacterium]
MRIVLKGNLISFIPVNESHLALMVRWRNDLNVSNMLFDRGRYTLTKQKKWFEKSKKDKSRKQFIIIENKNSTPIGAINLMQIDRKNFHCDWGYYIGETSFRMGGFAVEAEYMILKYAFEKLKMNKVYCQTLSYNNKVINIHNKFGFKTDGVLRRHYKEKKSYTDVVLMSILKGEFFEASKEIEKLLKFYRR